MSEEGSLLDVIRGLGKRPPPVLQVNASWANQEYVTPTTAEIELEFAELVSLREMVPPRDFGLPLGKGKKALNEALALADPQMKVAERATLRRLLRAKRVDVPPQCPTVEMVQLVLTAFRGDP